MCPRGKEEALTTYEPDNSIRKGLWSIFQDITDEIRKNHWLTYQLFKRDFSALYKQSFMGLLWVFIVPVFSVSTFVVLNHSGIFNVGAVEVPYPLYAVLGLSLWQLFSSGLVAQINSLTEAGTMIKLINFSKKSLIFASTGRALVAFGIQVLFTAALFVWFGVWPHPQTVFLPLALIPLLLLMFGMGFILSILNAVMRDIGNALSMLMTFFMFLTPILYVRPQGGLLARITNVNPLYYLVIGPRDLVLKGKFSEPAGYWASAAFALGLFIVCLVVFHLTETKITERV